MAVPVLRIPVRLACNGVINSPKHWIEPMSRIRIYAQLLDPGEHPDHSRHHVKPPTWETFGNRVHFTTLRQFSIRDNKLVDYIDELDKHTKTHELGDVIWPYNDILRTDNFADLISEIKKRKLFLFDIWGYVPGSGTGMWQQFRLEPEAAKTLESLGDHFMGMDNGEQDGRYTGYARQEYPIHNDDRLHHYFHFQRHFERLTTDLGNRMVTLVSLNYGHYFLKEGLYTMIGAETAQGLPNSQVYYAFIRGAGKQYGVPWFGNASVFNRWDEYKHYETEGNDHGPHKGTSLSLLKRLIYSHILYNSMVAGFDLSWFGKAKNNKGAELSPVGHIQQEAVRWSRKYGQPGCMITPIAVMIDFFAGWSFPRHLYATALYRVWGNLPYKAGDFLTDGVLDMLYPGYQDSSFYHDERGFLSPTPYGDSADCLLSDAEQWLLNRYAVLVVAGGLSGGLEIRDKLETYAAQGGHLIITAGNVALLPDGLAGVQVAGEVTKFPAGQLVQWDTESHLEKESFDLYPLIVPPSTQVLAKVGDMPAAIEMSYGRGKITVIGSPFGVSSVAVSSIPVLKSKYELDDKPLVKPYPLLSHVHKLLDTTFKAQQLFVVDSQLMLITCRIRAGEYTLGVFNNTWEPHPIHIAARCGAIESIKEIPLNQAEKKVIEYLPMPLQGQRMEANEGEIAGGDVRIFSVRVEERHVDVLSIEKAPSRRKGRFLPLWNSPMIKEDILKRPTFFEHFEGVCIDWTYLKNRDSKAIAQEAVWIGYQNLQIIIDFTSGINLYPDLRLVDNIQEDYDASMKVIRDVLTKAALLKVKNVVFSLHRIPQNNITEEETWAAFEKTFRQLCMEAKEKQMTIHLRMSQHKPPGDLKKAVDFINKVGAENLRLALDTGLLLTEPKDLRVVQDLIGLWMVGAPDIDASGTLINTSAPIAEYKESKRLISLLAADTRVPIVLSAVYANVDEEYKDIQVLNALTND